MKSEVSCAVASTPDVSASLPRHGLRGTLLRRFAHLTRGSLEIRFPDGDNVTLGNPGRHDRHGVLKLCNGRAVRRMIFGGSVGFAEGYISGDWTTTDIADLLDLLASDNMARTSLDGTRFARLQRKVRHWLNRNTRRGSRRNISFHYDLGNAFYQRWLDGSMTYSAGIFTTGARTLGEAQAEKYHRLARSLDLRPGCHVLEIGCGWGGFAEIAARDYGCRVTAVTLSQEQLRYARARMEAQGLADRVEIRFQDYRDIEGRFDRIASIEMFEAVGEEHWSTFFNKVNSLLTPDGRAAMQIITIAEDRFDLYRASPDFIQTYIFPGGMLPSPAILKTLTRDSGLALTDSFSFGQCYARTLEHWRETFLARWPEIEALGYDGRFKRTWDYYLAYCRAGFRTGLIDVRQFVMHKHENHPQR